MARSFLETAILMLQLYTLHPHLPAHETGQQRIAQDWLVGSVSITCRTQPRLYSQERMASFMMFSIELHIEAIPIVSHCPVM